MTDATADDLDRSDMARLGAGQDAALNDLMGRHAERLYHYLLRLLQNETEAADLAEEAFVRVYQNRSKFKRTNKFSTWLYTIATNLARDLQRYRARHLHLSLEAERGEAENDLRAILPATDPNPRELVEAAEREAVVRQAVGALPEELRTPLVLAAYEEKSHQEIARILACSPKAVEMRLYRARQLLRSRLERLLVTP